MKGPVLVELCLLLKDCPERLDSLTDTDFYHQITFANSLQHSRAQFLPQAAPELDEVAVAVLDRLSRSEFADASLQPRQAWFSTSGTLPRVVVVSDVSSAFAPADKPVGALWTASFLPDGTSAWQRREWAEFGTSRNLYAVTFDLAQAKIFTIDSLEDFEQLIHAYPRPAPDGRVLVRWTAVADDFDAVHLTARGLLTAHNIPLATPDGIATLAGWDAESTAWLRLPPVKAVSRCGPQAE
ncbi:hypothetical protein [Goodfellowiella coeruleoviolacea]|uniref:Uncharacterized protein n=1 Tax=Goodfellowiella coeruleoviolacea TaxID=334858 RepID=A0AAE3GBM9_9PSEU|nr:hypothetical protein [Goodfellowiella coeruleoviolacea]MCP2164838.1 hypothetical protein [Goodfellowiella coeruleoviolacea]